MDITSRPEKAGFDPKRLTRVARWMDRYVEQKTFPGSSIVISRYGKIIYTYKTGMRDVEAQKPWEFDTLVRIYSMTKPIVSVALMTFYEQGLIHLDQPVSDFLPEFKNPQVLIEGATRLDQTVAAIKEPTLHQLLTHTAGFTYSFNEELLAKAYRSNDYNFMPYQESLSSEIKKIAELPLLFQPGERWHYSIATDILGRILEVISDQPLDQLLQKVIFDPLNMDDSGFGVKPEQQQRYANLYEARAGGGMRLLDKASESHYLNHKVKTYSGGGGLLSTLKDYWTFAEMLRAKGRGNGEQILSPHTVDLMTANHIPGDIASMGPTTFSETPFTGVGYGLLGWIMLNPAMARVSGNKGDFGWGGMASTFFFVDPVEDVSVVFLTQLSPSSATSSRRELRALVYQALTNQA
jgi:CubicO group peptidase (beta-lactamase class C family)